MEGLPIVHTNPSAKDVSITSEEPPVLDLFEDTDMTFLDESGIDYMTLWKNLGIDTPSFPECSMTDQDITDFFLALSPILKPHSTSKLPEEESKFKIDNPLKEDQAGDLIRSSMPQLNNSLMPQLNASVDQQHFINISCEESDIEDSDNGSSAPTKNLSDIVRSIPNRDINPEPLNLPAKSTKTDVSPSPTRKQGRKAKTLVLKPPDDDSLLLLAPDGGPVAEAALSLASRTSNWPNAWQWISTRLRMPYIDLNFDARDRLPHQKVAGLFNRWGHRIMWKKSGPDFPWLMSNVHFIYPGTRCCIGLYCMNYTMGSCLTHNGTVVQETKLDYSIPTPPYLEPVHLELLKCANHYFIWIYTTQTKHDYYLCSAQARRCARDLLPPHFRKP